MPGGRKTALQVFDPSPARGALLSLPDFVLFRQY